MMALHSQMTPSCLYLLLPSLLSSASLSSLHLQLSLGLGPHLVSSSRLFPSHLLQPLLSHPSSLSPLSSSSSSGRGPSGPAWPWWRWCTGRPGSPAAWRHPGGCRRPWGAPAAARAPEVGTAAPGCAAPGRTGWSAARPGACPRSVTPPVRPLPRCPKRSRCHSQEAQG